MQYQNYNPLVYRSLGANDPNQLLTNIGSQYGYLGPNTQTNPNYYTPSGPGAGQYVINNQVFRSQNDYNNLNNYLGSRANFLDTQLRDNSQAYNEYAKNPYAFKDNSPFKTAAQKSAEQEAARQAALLAAQGGTSQGVGTGVSTPVGLTGGATPITNNRTVPAGAGLTEIPRNNNALIRELHNLLGTIPGLFNVQGITRGFKDRIAMDESFGNQAANNAASEFANRTIAEGGDASLAGLVRAQAMLPVLQHSGELQSQLADKQLQARTSQGQLTASVAEALGNLRTNYLKGLVDYTGKIQDIQSANQQNTQRLNEQGREFDLGHSLDLDKLTLMQRQQKESEKSNRLQALMAMSQLNDKKVDPYNNPTGPAWIPSNFRTVDPYKQSRNQTLDDLLRQLQGL